MKKLIATLVVFFNMMSAFAAENSATAERLSPPPLPQWAFRPEIYLVAFLILILLLSLAILARMYIRLFEMWDKLRPK